jgi:hypothetical protein
MLIEIRDTLDHLRGEIGADRFGRGGQVGIRVVNLESVLHVSSIDAPNALARIRTAAALGLPAGYTG